MCWRRGSVRKWQIFSGCVFSNSSALELVSPRLPTPPLSDVKSVQEIAKAAAAVVKNIIKSVKCFFSQHESECKVTLTDMRDG